MNGAKGQVFYPAAVDKTEEPMMRNMEFRGFLRPGNRWVWGKALETASQLQAG